MNRRAFLATGTSVGIGLTAGCLTDVIAGEEIPEEMILEPPEDEHGGNDDLAYPTYGETFPTIELPDPLAETTVDTSTFDDEAIVCTGFYATCPSECIPLMNNVAAVQYESIDSGFEDDVRFLAITFDPEQDTPAELDEHADMVGVDRDAGNWHYLRPADADEARSVVNDELGIMFDRDGEGPAADFTHIVVTFLVNPDGYVERSYRGEHLDVDRVSSDLETVVDEAN
ncbi:SCO family protein [Natronolimnohabitans sp. A-GB9]|uniref:SCO family protein n=1 Tax=Natronolimnohabitans sp. A-GB9 TaxID=3069757 RepID=UPI0027B3F279|nr:SCO family protein [Natronolimnohabitans sp. A-GB9]MDQ2049994.1 SCO family protein [Natronolimnohabitans sp. A-GB9]